MARGFSLIELLVVLAVTAVASAMAWPTFQQMRDERAWAVAATDFLATLTHARAEAMGRGVRVAVAPADGRHWQMGWITFIDANMNGRHEPGESVLLRREALPRGITVESRQTLGGELPFIAYAASGHSRTGRWGWLSGSVDFIWRGRVRCVIVNAVGRPRLALSDDAANSVTSSGCRPRG